MHTNLMDLLLDRIVSAFSLKKKRTSAKLYFILYEAIKEGITNQDIPVGVSLPATRLVAKALHLSRSTAVKAYELLVLEGFVAAKTGSGYTVLDQKPTPRTTTDRIDNSFGYPELSERGKAFLNNITLINSIEDKSIAFRPGLPPLDIFPVNQWKSLTNLYWRYIKSSALSYSPSSGLDQLKMNIANYLNLSRGLKCDYQQIIIVSGTVQSMYMIGNVLLNSGDMVLMENPTFPNVHSIFKGMNALVKGIDVDESGLKTSLLQSAEYGQAKLLHVTPSNHYPTGHVMSMERRQEVLAWANANNAIIMENDYEHEISNKEHSLPALFSLDQQQRTIFMSTFNRLMHPSIRLGYMVVPYYLLDAVEALQLHSHRFVPPSVQIVMNQFIEKKYLYNHVKQVVEAAQERKQVFIDQFEQRFGQLMSIAKSQSNNLFLMADIKGEVKDKKLVDQLMAHNIVAHPLSKCYVGEPQKQGLILGYSSVRVPVIKRKLEQMQHALL